MACNLTQNKLSDFHIAQRVCTPLLCWRALFFRPNFFLCVWGSKIHDGGDGKGESRLFCQGYLSDIKVLFCNKDVIFIFFEMLPHTRAKDYPHDHSNKQKRRPQNSVPTQTLKILSHASKSIVHSAYIRIFHTHCNVRECVSNYLDAYLVTLLQLFAKAFWSIYLYMKQ